MARIAMPVAEGFEDAELMVPYRRLLAAGHDLVIFGARRGETVTGKRYGASVTITAEAPDIDPDAFDALVIPGGHSPDHLRIVPEVVEFVRRFAHTGRPIAAICHGPQLLIEAGAVRGRTLTSWPSVRTDLENAGARWVDRPVVRDGNLITSRKPGDLDAFCDALIECLGAAAA
jgi:protease I